MFFFYFSTAPGGDERSNGALSTVLVQVPIQPRAKGERRNDEADACHRAPPESTALPAAAPARIGGWRRGRRRGRTPRVTVAATALAVAAAGLARARASPVPALAVSTLHRHLERPAGAAAAPVAAAPVQAAAPALASLAVAALPARISEPLLGAGLAPKLVALARGLDVLDQAQFHKSSRAAVEHT